MLEVYGTLLRAQTVQSCYIQKMSHVKPKNRENIILLHHLTSDVTWSDLQFSEQNVSAYYSIMVVYLYVGEHHPVVNGRKHF